MDDIMTMADITNRAVPGRKKAAIRQRAEDRKAAAVDLEETPWAPAAGKPHRGAGYLLAGVAGTMLMATLLGAAVHPAKALDKPAPAITPPAEIHEADLEVTPMVATTYQYVYLEEVPLPYWLQESMQTYCLEYRVPYALALAIAETESSFDETADSGWAYGTMQIGYINHDWLQAEGMDPTDREGNVKAGIYMIGDLLDRYQDPTMALMCYNAGETGAAELRADGYESTAYSRQVIARQQQWQRILDAAQMEA